MPIGIGVATLIGGAASAGAAVAGGAMSSGAAKDAAKSQEASSREALALQKQIYEEQVKRQQPYYDQSVKSLGSLGQMASGAHQRELPAPYQNPYAARLGQIGQAPPPMPQAPQGPPPGQPIPPPGPPGGGGEDFVTVQAPNGQTRDLPMSLAQQMVAKGAKILGPAQMRGGQ